MDFDKWTYYNNMVI
uniref:Uncharacterized protein n=1 Tax=Arundo donax TaxID=35708 RepID=A0A0A9BME1_ARUDO